MAKGKRDLALERVWRRRLATWRRSGVTVREFCDFEEVSESAFYYWRRELQRRQGEGRQATARPLFVPVRVRDEVEGPASGDATADGGVEIVLPSGRVIRVRRGFDRVLLGEVLAALEGRA